MSNSNHDKRAIVLDLDGTLVESAPDLMSALNAALDSEGRREVSLAEVKSMIGDGMPTLVRRGFEATGGTPEDSVLTRATDACVSEYLANPVGESHLYPGVEETLSVLAAAGHPVAVCTNKPYEPALAVLQGLGLGDSFKVIVGGDSYAYRKPDPRLLQATLHQLGATAANSVMVGDSDNDAKVAHGAGVPFVLVTFGYCTTPHEQLQPAAVIDRFEQLPAAVQGLAESRGLTRTHAEYCGTT